MGQETGFKRTARQRDYQNWADGGWRGSKPDVYLKAWNDGYAARNLELIAKDDESVLDMQPRPIGVPRVADTPEDEHTIAEAER